MPCTVLRWLEPCSAYTTSMARLTELPDAAWKIGCLASDGAQDAVELSRGLLQS